MNDERAWRDIKAPDSLMARVLRGRPATRHGAPWVWRTAAVAGCVLLIGIITLLPRRSSAASSLSKLVGNHARMEVMFRIIPYWVEHGKLEPKIFSGYVKGDRWRYVQADMEQSFDGSRLLTYIKEYNVVYTEMGSQHGAGNILGTADLSQWRIVNPEGLRLEHNVLWKGRRVDKYTMPFPFKGEDGKQHQGMSTLYADPDRNLPLYDEDIYSPTKGSAREWQYIHPADERLLRIDLPQGVTFKEVPVKTSGGSTGEPEKAARTGG